MVDGAVVGYPHFFTRIKQKHPDCLLASIVAWAPINTKILTDADYQAASSEDGVAEKCIDLLLGDRNHSVVFLQFDIVDHAGHTSGFDPKEPGYLQAIEATDRRIGTILKALEKRPSLAEEDWLILVTADHGGRGTGHGGQSPGERTVFIIATGGDYPHEVVEGKWNITAVPPTVFHHLGLAVDPAWGWESAPFGVSRAWNNRNHSRTGWKPPYSLL